MKSGIKTSEFWMAVVGAGLLVLNKGLGLDIPEETVNNFAYMVISYVFGRSVIKATSK